MQYKKAFIAALAAGANALPNNLVARQGITSAVSPSSAAPSGCSINYSGSFGIAVQSITAAGSATTTAAISQITDGQPQVSSTGAVVSVAPVSQITDGQIQATTSAPAATLVPVSQISDGQIQASSGVTVMTMGMVSMIHDGQIQAPVTHIGITVIPVSQISDGQIQAPTSTAVPISQINDGQIQAPKSTATPVSQISDGQVQAPTSTVTPVSQISDGQVQASTATAITQKSDGQPQATSAASSSSMMQLVGCATNSTLSLTLENGILTDSEGRTGYIASNYQFQFDKPAQAGAIFTSGFSVCSNGSLALGGSAVFYECLSGGFFNLYDRSWAAQCHPVLIRTLMLESC